MARIIQKKEGNFLQKLSLSFFIGCSFIVMILDTLHRDNFQFIRSSVLNVSTVVYNVIEAPIYFFDGVIESALDYRSTVQKNDELKKQVLKLEEFKNEYYVLKQENETFKKLLNYNAKIEKSFLTSRVIGDTGGIYMRTLLLDMGSKDNVEKNDAVMGIGGLLGKIVEVSYNNSRVLLLTDINSAVPVFILGSNERAIMVGDATDIPVLKFINEIENVKVGQKVVTSGEGGLFPNGLPIGEVIEIDKTIAKIKTYSNNKNNLFTRIVKFKYKRN